MSNYAVGNSPTAVTGNDLNGDNYVDFATADYGGNDIAVILNNGDGSFAAPVTYSTGNNTRTIDAGDFDGDGDIDLTGSNNGSNTVAVLLNNGDGTYANSVVYTVGTNPWGIISADYDLDGALDIACCNYNSDNITVLYNSGLGIQEQTSISALTQLSIDPNPCRDKIMIKYCIGYESSYAVIDIFDICGRLVKSFILSPCRSYEMNSISWNGIDKNNKEVANGVYFCRLKTEEETLTDRFVFIK